MTSVVKDTPMNSEPHDSLNIVPTDDQKKPSMDSETTKAATIAINVTNISNDDSQYEQVLTDYLGNPIDGKWIKDPMVWRWTYIVTFILVCSWTAQWVIYALPYWRGDIYHQGGLFQVCGDRWFTFDPHAGGNTGEIYPNISILYKCQPLKEYIDDFTALVEAPVDPNVYHDYDHWARDAKETYWHILASRYFEAISTIFSMIFGLTTIYMVVRPSPNERINMKNGIFALVGIVLTPWFCAIDIFLSINSWNWVGVGVYTHSPYDSMYACGQISIGTAAIDLAVQLVFLKWAFKMYRKRVPFTPVVKPKWWESD